VRLPDDIAITDAEEAKRRSVTLPDRAGHPGPGRPKPGSKLGQGNATEAVTPPAWATTQTAELPRQPPSSLGQSSQQAARSVRQRVCGRYVRAHACGQGIRILSCAVRHG
jgi:hypothetical protein